MKRCIELLYFLYRNKKKLEMLSTQNGFSTNYPKFEHMTPERRKAKIEAYKLQEDYWKNQVIIALITILGE